MKRLGLYLCVGILSFAFTAIYTPSAQAQFETPDAVLGAGAAPDSAAVLSAKTPPDVKPNLGDPVPKGCSFFGNSPIVDCIDVGVTFLIKNTLLQFAGFLTWLSANMLNFAIQVSILDFAEWSPSSLYPIWVIIRQIVSLVVVFAGLYLGFMYIIGREDTFGKYVGWLAIFALFVNFSYPVTRALVDVSNIVSLNVYSSAVGSETVGTSFGSEFNTLGGNTAGALIVNRLGLTELFVSATKVTSETGFDTKTGSGFVGQINTTPGALAAVVFALYAAYVLFMATAILVMRSAVLAFLIVASPLLLVDAVVPKLGDVAVKMRKMFFEQLIVAPVFMIMLALTLKFMDVFQTAGGPLASGEGVKVFFNILMMIVMLHIMLKVTKATAGAAGEMATSAMGKVGGFGLGVASGGAGFLARGSVGLAAARLRDSGMMDKMQGSRTGRGLYSLTNSLAQSTFDTRNLGMVNRGLASAGMGMGKGTTQTYDKDFEARDSAMKKKYGSIKDGSARDGYIAQKTGSLGSMGQQTMLLGRAKSDAQITADSIEKGKNDSIKKYAQIKDEDKKREYLESLPEDVQTQIKNEGGASQVQATEAEAIAEEQRMNPTEEAKMMSAAEIAEMQKNFAASKEAPPVDIHTQSFADRKQAEAQRSASSGSRNNEGASSSSSPRQAPIQSVNTGRTTSGGSAQTAPSPTKKNSPPTAHEKALSDKRQELFERTEKALAAKNAKVPGEEALEKQIKDLKEKNKNTSEMNVNNSSRATFSSQNNEAYIGQLEKQLSTMRGPRAEEWQRTNRAINREYDKAGENYRNAQGNYRQDSSTTV